MSLKCVTIDLSYYTFLKRKKKSANRHIQNARGNSLVGQWLGLSTLIAKGPGSIPGWGTKIPQAVWHGPKKKKNARKPTTGAAGIPREGENFITSRKKLFLRESHVSCERQHHLKALSFIDTEKQRI